MGYLDLVIWFPTLVTAVLWIHARSLDELSTRQTVWVAAVALAAFVMQLRGGLTVGTLGMVVQVGVAIFLLLRQRASR